MWQWFDAFVRDTRFAARVLRKSPGFALTAIGSLALGIGANTIVYSVVNALVLKPLPIADPQRVLSVNGNGRPSHSFPNYRDLRDRNSVFESLFSYRIVQVALDDAAGAHRLWGYLVTGNYFETLGIKPVIGRFFTPAEDTRVNASPYAVLSYSCWQNRFGGDPSIAGKEVRVNGNPYTVLGVTPRGFHGTEVFFWPEIWVPMMMQGKIEDSSWLENRNTFNAWIAGRLKPGVAIARAEANLNQIAAQLGHEHTVNEGIRFSLSAPGLGGAMGREPMQAFAGGVMLLASLVLLAACANLATLLAARGADRSRDLGIRVSIGAGRGRIVRQLLTESLWISVLGGAAGCAVALLLLRLLSQWRAPLEFPIQFDVSPDWTVFLFALSAAIGTSLLSGAGPALRAWKADPMTAMKGTAGAVSIRRWAARDVLLPVQIALCCVLVTSSLVALRGLMRSLDTPLGFAPEGTAVAGFDLGLAGYAKDQGSLFQERALQEITHLPGVMSAAYASSTPLSIDQSNTSVFREDTTDFRPRNAHRSYYYRVSPGYFQTAGTRLVAGRDFTSLDNRKSRPVAIVNQKFARDVTGQADAVGRRFRYAGQFVEIVGIVEDSKYENLTEAAKAAMFVPILQNYSPTGVLLARSRLPESAVAAEMRQALLRLDPHLPVYGVGSLHQMLGFVYLPMNAAVFALGGFGVLAIALAITGIYGLSAYTVARRNKEIGIRMAIGARPGHVLRLVFGRTGILVAAGAIAGLSLGAAGASVLSSIVYQANSRDPVVIGAAVAAIAVVALAAAFGPARRALRVDPIRALRQE